MVGDLVRLLGITYLGALAIVEIFAGGTAIVGGGGVSLTGAGALVGVPAAALGAALVAVGVGTAGVAIQAGSTAWADFQSDLDAYKEAKEYGAPSGGGGTTNSISTNGKTVNFGHGGRHLEGSGLSIDTVEKQIADEVSKLELKTGVSYEGKITVDGTEIIYRAYVRSEGIINVGTYFVN